MLCTFATSQGERDAERLPRDVRQFMLRYNQYLSPLGWTRTIARFNELIRGIAAEEGVALVDCEHAMTGDARYFRDYVHFTPAGHERMAELITEKLRDIEPVSPVAASGLGANE
jgi:lysophospholipase L1-like esterase